MCDVAGQEHSVFHVGHRGPTLLPDQPQLPHEKRPNVKLIGDVLVQRLAGTVPGLRLNPQQNRPVRRARRLQRRRHLAGVHRVHNPPVALGGREEHGRIRHALLNVVVGRKTKIACLSHVSNVSGVVNDVKRIAKVAHDNSALMLVDGAQSVPHMNVDVKDLDMDFLAFSGHKMLGPTGIGALYGKKDLLQKMGPFQGGGEMIKEVSFSQAKERCDISWNDPPWKFEAGTPNICGGIALMEAIKYLEKISMTEVLKHEKQLAEYAVKRMRECGKVTLHGPTDLSLRCGIIPLQCGRFIFA